ncbi:hypothetical protein MKO06_05470 [Gramella sp. GC03-9]|uniref:Outer membrane protein beta-barrel domain-containing protein n=1 Tax=Christiangramia oceanisediminis TaxID=2920386 RepID=A0A9X2I3W0_9FLAO|nr:hypothetical protein [Gramella oceanisediminis]MCP9199345.1 hypothetical protein [Gramella oceanisediminis]
MKLYFKCFILFFVLHGANAQNEEETESDSDAGIKVFVGGSKPFALDDNFIGDSYNLKYGAEVGVLYLFTDHWFAGAQVDVLWTDVTNSEKLGGINRTRIISSSLNGGYLTSLTGSLEFSAKLGFGHARYANRASENGRAFHDDAFITYLEPKLAYLINDGIGIYLGLNFRYDNMSIKTSDQYEDYFSSSTRLAPTVGAQFSF